MSALGHTLETLLPILGLGRLIGLKAKAAAEPDTRPPVAPALTPLMALASRGELGVGEVISNSSVATGIPVIALELDAIGAPKRRVTAEPPPDQTLKRGDRIYVRLDPTDPFTVFTLPISVTGGVTPDRNGGRIDPLVLGPRLLSDGEKAIGTVKSATPVPFENAGQVASRIGAGISRWRLEFEVRPLRGWPFTASLILILSTPEKAARVTHIGAELPVRYDPLDTRSIDLDTIEMGWGDPYAAYRANGFGTLPGGDSDEPAASNEPAPWSRESLGDLAVGEVVSALPDLILELDAIGAPKRRVRALAAEGLDLTVGDRVYARLNPNDPDAVAILTPSMTGGERLVKGGPRLDYLVLGPRMLRDGAKATGRVKLAEPFIVPPGYDMAYGFSAWRLAFEVEPERGWPFTAQLTTVLSSPEKAARIARVGAEVALRYDPDDPKTLMIDAIAMGFGDPYPAYYAHRFGWAAP